VSDERLDPTKADGALIPMKQEPAPALDLEALEGHTPGPWEYGVRKDGSVWLSIGNPYKGEHWQGDLYAKPVDAALIAAAPALLAEVSRLTAERDAWKARCEMWEAAYNALREQAHG